MSHILNLALTAALFATLGAFAGALGYVAMDRANAASKSAKDSKHADEQIKRSNDLINNLRVN